MGFKTDGVSVFIHRYKESGFIWAKLEKVLVYTTESGLVIKVPKGFDTNFASIPKALWSLFPPLGKYTQASILHDYLYAEGRPKGYSRKYADDIFYEAMRSSHVNIFSAKLIYWCVRVFGASHYNNNLPVQEV